MRAVRSYIREAGPVIAASYPVCAIHPGKKSPIGKNWNHHPLSPEECASYRYMAGDNVGVGIICGIGDDPVYGIDCDILGDEELRRAADAVAQALGPELHADHRKDLG